MINKLKLILLVLIILPCAVLAQGSVSVSTGSLNIQKGGSSSFTVTANNAAGKITISSSNPSVATVSLSEVFLDMQSSTITVNGISAGTATITIYNNDVTTYDDDDLSGQSRTISVTVGDSSSSTVTKVEPTPVINNDAYLSSLTFSNGTIEFNKDTLEYTIEVDNSIESINISPILSNKSAKLVKDGPESLSVGDNKYVLTITSSDGTTVKTYTINVIRKEASNNNNLKTLSINNYNLKFDNNILKYNLTISNEDYLTFNIEPEEEGATYEIIGNKNLKNGSKIEVIVTALNGDKKTYTINILKNVCKNNNTGLYICIGIIIVLLGIIGYFIYIVYFKNKNNNNTQIKKETKEYDINHQKNSPNNNANIEFYNGPINNADIDYFNGENNMKN